MKKLILAMALVVALLSTACSGGGNTAPAPREAAAPTTDTAYCGTYQGTLPAADCPGIKTVLTIAVHRPPGSACGHQRCLPPQAGRQAH